jgi:DNA-directed RNA polymerase subunit RPC12/RpoP
MSDEPKECPYCHSRFDLTYLPDGTVKIDPYVRIAVTVPSWAMRYKPKYECVQCGIILKDLD